jgi:hypothetical protein
VSPGSAGQVEMCERRDKALRGCDGIIGKHGGHPAYAILSPLSQVRVLLTKPSFEIDVGFESHSA